MTRKRQMTNEEHLKIFSDSHILTQAIEKAVNKAVLGHKQAGQKVCAWEDGKVVWYNPDEIPD